MDRAVEERRRRRVHTSQFKTEVIRACREPGVSVAAVALSNGLNSNLVRRWLKASGVGEERSLPADVSPAVVNRKFLAVQIESSPPPSPTGSSDIRLELRRGGATVIVSWPANEAGACGSWLREWLR